MSSRCPQDMGSIKIQKHTVSLKFWLHFLSYLLVVNGELAGCVLSLSEVFDFSLSWATWYREQKFKKLFKLNGTNTWKLGPSGKVSNNKIIIEPTEQ